MTVEERDGKNQKQKGGKEEEEGAQMSGGRLARETRQGSEQSEEILTREKRIQEEREREKGSSGGAQYL